MSVRQGRPQNFIADDILIETKDGVALLGGRSKDSGTFVFPVPKGAEGDRYEKVALSRQGALWTYTVQRFPPKAPYLGEQDPAKFRPFAVGYVELEDQLLIEARLDVEDPDALRIGQKMELTFIDLAKAEGGSVLRTFAFRPV